MTNIVLSTVIPEQHPFAESLAAICVLLPEPFTLQDVVEATERHAPDNLEELPTAWACLRSIGQVETVGLSSATYRLVHGA
jgi:hypothetical protein